MFGGFSSGGGIGLSVRGGAVLDGTSIGHLPESETGHDHRGHHYHYQHPDLLCRGLLSFVEIALFSMITYLAASKILDFIVEGIDEHISVTIISSQEEIRRMIIDVMGQSTVYSGKRGYGKRGETIQAGTSLINGHHQT